jgi:hypothetical protein
MTGIDTTGRHTSSSERAADVSKPTRSRHWPVAMVLALISAVPMLPLPQDVPSAIAAPASSPELVPFIGTFRISATWGSPSNGYHAASDEAIDFELPSGTPVLAAGAGTVSAVTNDNRNCNPSIVNPNDFAAGIRWCNQQGYIGVSVTIRHADGRFSRYLHLSSLAAGISKDATVAAGQQLGLSGNSGISTGPHLHYQEGIWGGESSVDPGPMTACHGASVVNYDNMQNRFREYIRSDGFSCAGGGGGGGDGGVGSFQNGGFESGNTGWKVTHNPGGVVNRSVYSDGARARSGSGFLEANTSVANGSVGQDIPVAPQPGSYYRLRVWVRDASGGPGPFRLGIALWALGGDQENATVTALVGGTWTPVDVVLPVTRGGHSGLRIEFYMGTTGRNVNFDDATLTVTSTNPGVNTSNPVGSFDAVSSPEPGKIRVSGWAFDPNDPTTPIGVHVYIGGPYGTPGTVSHDLGAASVNRPDVASAYPYAGANHGFETTLPTSKSGRISVCTYAINIHEGVNVLLPNSCREVDVQAVATKPSAPTITSVMNANNAVAVTFTPPTSTGSSPISNYAFSIDGGATWTNRTPASTASPMWITGLANGTSYSIRLRAVNAAGSGEASATMTATPAPTRPSAARIMSITPGNGSLNVMLGAPLSDGGSPITNYRYSTNNGATWTTRSPASATSPLVIPGLTNGISYSVRVQAVNELGAGPMSAAVVGVPARAPSAPTVTSVLPGNGVLIVQFTAPAVDGGSPIINYQYSTDGGATWTTRRPAATVAPLRITGLVNGTSYSVRLRAMNAAGPGAASTTTTGTPAPTRPAAPTITSITPGNGSLSIAFTPPPNNGGSPITNYRYSTDNGVTWVTRTPASTAGPLVISGLTAGASYSVRIQAVNAVGVGAMSVAVTGVPARAPLAPTITSIGPGNGTLSVNFSAPSSDGGSPITSYEYSINGGATWVPRTPGSVSSPITIGGLANGTAYSVMIRAVNVIGPGDQSTAVSGTPVSPVGTVSIGLGTRSTGACRYGNGGWNDPTGCYHIQINMSGWPGSHTVRCWASWSNSTWWNFETFTAGNGTHQACSYSSAGRGVVVSVDTVVGGVAYSNVYNAGSGGAVSNIYGPWPSS